MNEEEQRHVMFYCENQNFEDAKQYILEKNVLKQNFGWLYHYLFLVCYEEMIHWLFDQFPNIDKEKELNFALERNDKDLILLFGVY